MENKTELEKLLENSKKLIESYNIDIENINNDDIEKMLENNPDFLSKMLKMSSDLQNAIKKHNNDNL